MGSISHCEHVYFFFRDGTVEHVNRYADWSEKYSEHSLENVVVERDVKSVQSVACSVPPMSRSRHRGQGCSHNNPTWVCSCRTWLSSYKMLTTWLQTTAEALRSGSRRLTAFTQSSCCSRLRLLINLKNLTPSELSLPVFLLEVTTNDRTVRATGPALTASYWPLHVSLATILLTPWEPPWEDIFRPLELSEDNKLSYNLRFVTYLVLFWPGVYIELERSWAARWRGGYVGANF